MVASGANGASLGGPAMGPARPHLDTSSANPAALAVEVIRALREIAD
jgi:hypothetical protein